LQKDHLDKEKKVKQLHDALGKAIKKAKGMTIEMALRAKALKKMAKSLHHLNWHKLEEHKDNEDENQQVQQQMSILLEKCKEHQWGSTGIRSLSKGSKHGKDGKKAEQDHQILKKKTVIKGKSKKSKGKGSRKKSRKALKKHLSKDDNKQHE
jgi:hypothetical protein